MKNEITITKEQLMKKCAESIHEMTRHIEAEDRDAGFRLNLLLTLFTGVLGSNLFSDEDDDHE